MPTTAYRFAETFAHLDDADAGVTPLEVNETFWPDLAAGRLGLGPGRLVSYYEFDADWASWEVHPQGDEVVCLIAGAVDFLLEEEGGTTTLEMRKPGTFTIVPRGIWHTAKVREPSTLLVITAGAGTQHRPV